MALERKIPPRFITIVELVFAFFMTASLYSVIEHLDITVFQNLLKFGLCTLILIRFFFAPTSNIECMLVYTRKSNWRRWSILFWDFPALIMHAAFFYFICTFFWKYAYLNNREPFLYFLSLLIFNSLWLSTISYRLWKWEKIEKRRIYRFYVWIWNNLSFSILISLFINSKLSLLMFFGYLNCIIDILLTAPDYLEQRVQNKPVIKFLRFKFWPRSRL